MAFHYLLLPFTWFITVLSESTPLDAMFDNCYNFDSLLIDTFDIREGHTCAGFVWTFVDPLTHSITSVIAPLSLELNKPVNPEVLYQFITLGLPI